MVENGFGHVVNISSIWGRAGPSNRSSYSSAKFAIIGLMDCVRNEVRVRHRGGHTLDQCHTVLWLVVDSSMGGHTGSTSNWVGQVEDCSMWDAGSTSH